MWLRNASRPLDVPLRIPDTYEAGIMEQRFRDNRIILPFQGPECTEMCVDS